MAVGGNRSPRYGLVLLVLGVEVTAQNVHCATRDASHLRDFDVAVVVLCPEDMAGGMWQWNERVVVAAGRAATGLPHGEGRRACNVVGDPLCGACVTRAACQCPVGVIVLVRLGWGVSVKDGGAYSESGSCLESSSLASVMSDTSENFGSASLPTFTFHAAVSSFK